MIFVMNGVPAIAIAAERMMEHLTEVTHTEKDTYGLVDSEVLAETAFFIRDVIQRINNN